MRRGVDRQPRLSRLPCHARRRAPCAPVGALAALHQPARRGTMHPWHCAGRQPACLRTEQGSMLRTLAQRQLASKQALSPLHSRPRAPAAALLNTEAQEPPLVVAALCSAACEQRSARQTPGTPGRLCVRRRPAERMRATSAAMSPAAASERRKEDSGLFVRSYPHLHRCEWLPQFDYGEDRTSLAQTGSEERESGCKTRTQRTLSHDKRSHVPRLRMWGLHDYMKVEGPV